MLRFSHVIIFYVRINSADFLHATFMLCTFGHKICRVHERYTVYMGDDAGFTNRPIGNSSHLYILTKIVVFFKGPNFIHFNFNDEIKEKKMKVY